MEHVKKEKLPLGLMTKWRWEEIVKEQGTILLEARWERIGQILDAMDRYSRATKRIPEEWMEELREINQKQG